MTKYPLVKVESKDANYPYDEWFRQHAEIAEAFVKFDKKSDGTTGMSMIHDGKKFPDPEFGELIMRRFFDRVRSVAELYWTGPNVDYSALSKWNRETLQAIAKIYYFACRYHERAAMECLEHITECATPEIFVFRPTEEVCNRINTKLKTRFREKNKKSLMGRLSTIFYDKKDDSYIENFVKNTVKANLEQHIKPNIESFKKYGGESMFFALAAGLPLSRSPLFEHPPDFLLFK